MALKSQEGLLNACLQSWTLTLTLASYPTISSKSSPPRKYNSFARTRKPICCLFLARCIFRLTKDLNTKWGQLFCSPYVFVTKPGRQTVTYKLAFKLYITICATCITLTGRCSVCFFRLFVFLVIALYALGPRFNSQSNCTQGNRVTSTGLHKKGILSRHHCQ